MIQEPNIQFRERLIKEQYQIMLIQALMMRNLSSIIELQVQEGIQSKISDCLKES